MAAHEVEETTPLLQDAARSRSPSPVPTARQWTKDIFRPSPIIIIMAFLSWVEFGGLLLTLPTNNLLEQAVCDHIHPKAGGLSANGIDGRCKDPAVQTELSFIRYWTLTLSLLPSLLLSIPYGRLGDTLGRIPVLRLSLIGLALGALCETAVYLFPYIFPPRAVWLAPLCCIIGGGEGVMSSMALTSIADFTPQDKRSTAFSYISVAGVATQLIATPTASMLMDRSPWLCLAIGVVIFISCIPLSYAIPETLSKPEISLSQADTEDAIIKPTIYGRLKLAINALLSMDLSFAWKNASVFMLLIVILCTTLGRFANELILQYSTYRYHWEWSKANYLTMIGSATNIVTMMFLLPWISALVDRKTSLSPASRDIWLMRGAVAIVTCGLVLMGLSATPVLMVIGLVPFTFGPICAIFVRSTLTNLTGGHNIAALYNVMTFVAVLGGIIAGPLLGVIFNQGIRLGGFWLGLPFLTAAGLFAFSFVLVMFVRAPAQQTEEVTDA